MKNNISLIVLLFCSITAFGQSVLLTPESIDNKNTTGKNIILHSSNNDNGIFGRRYNGTLSSPTFPTLGQTLFTVGAGGAYSNGSIWIDQTASMKFLASENWGIYSGTRITFNTTQSSGGGPYERMTVNHDGFIGIGTPSPLGKLQIDHSTSNNINIPHLRLRTTNDASFGMIRMENNTASRFFTQYFGVTSATAGNNFVSWDYNGTNAMLTLYGNGNAEIAGFTKLGSDASSPKVKMKKITGTNGAVSATTAFPHGLTQSKILSVSILINDSVNFLDNPPFLSETGYKYEFYVDGSNIQIVNATGNSYAIAGRPVKILITYEE
jgi:hypothetical protein